MFPRSKSLGSKPRPTSPRPSRVSSSSASPSTNSSSVPSIEPSHPNGTIAQILAPFAVPLTDIRQRYASILSLIRSLVGAIPNSESILQIFPPAFTTCNLLVPNALNVPFVLWGLSAPPELVGLAMYFCARSFQCAYCSLHTCTFARRRGLDEDAISGTRSFTPREAAVVEAALNMSSFPNHLVEDDRHRLYRHLSVANVEWIVLAIAMMGFLTTFMDSLGVDMEQDLVDEATPILKKAGWSQGKHNVAPPKIPEQADSSTVRRDSFISNFMMLRHLPQAISYDLNATRNIPKSWPAIGNYLLRTVGHSFPILGLLTHTRAVRAIAEMIRLNLDAIICGIEPDLKYLIGIVFAGVHCNRLMAKEFRQMTMLMVDYMNEEKMNVIFDFSKEETDFNVGFEETMRESCLTEMGLDESQVRMLYIAKACCFAPTRTTRAVVEATKTLRPEYTVELLCWVSLLSMLQKLYIFYYPSCAEQVTVVNGQLGERAPMFTKLSVPRME